MKQSILLSSLAFVSTISLASSLHSNESNTTPNYDKDLITIQPHTRSAAVNARHAAECAQRGGVDVTDEHVFHSSKDVTDSILCEIKDIKKHNTYHNNSTTSLKKHCTTFDYQNKQYTYCAQSYSYYGYGYPINYSSTFTVDIASNAVAFSTHFGHGIYAESMEHNPGQLFCVDYSSSGNTPGKTTVYELINQCHYKSLPWQLGSQHWKVNYNNSSIYSIGVGTSAFDSIPVKLDYPYNDVNSYYPSQSQNLGAVINNNMCTLQSSGVGNPINVITSNKFQREVDFVGRGSYPLEFIRYYNSQDEGGKWRHSYSAHITITLYDNHNPKVSLIHDDGREEVYFESSNGDLLSQFTSYGVLKRNKDGFTYDTPFAEHLEFDRGGFLTKTVKNGLVHNVQHISKLETKVSDEFGQTLTIIDNGYGNVDQVKLPSGRMFYYKYDGQQRLIEVYKNNKTRKYHYENPKFPFALTGITDENGSRYVTWSYDDEGRAISSEYAGGMNKYSVSKINYYTNVSNPLGGGSRYDYNGVFGMGVITKSYGMEDVNNSSGNITKRYYGGVTTTFDYNSLGQETNRKVAGVDFGTTWDDRHPNKPKTVTYPDKTINYSYDNDGNVTDVVITSNN